MVDAWQTLRAGGLPLTIAAATTRPSEAELAAAVATARAERPTGRDAEALAAMILGWRKHWPDGFARAFSDPAELAAWAEAQLPDPDRLLKLRRIAVANLADVL